jgi:hypothetical protein
MTPTRVKACPLAVGASRAVVGRNGGASRTEVARMG